MCVCVKLTGALHVNLLASPLHLCLSFWLCMCPFLSILNPRENSCVILFLKKLMFGHFLQNESQTSMLFCPKRWRMNSQKNKFIHDFKGKFTCSTNSSFIIFLRAVLPSFLLSPVRRETHILPQSYLSHICDQSQRGMDDFQNFQYCDVTACNSLSLSWRALQTFVTLCV